MPFAVNWKQSLLKRRIQLRLPGNGSIESDRIEAGMAAADIVVRGAREHNLQNVDLVIPRNKLVVMSGVSGSGKSSLAFDTVYAEGQRRYVESLSTYARQFLGQMPKPEVDSITGLAPSVAAGLLCRSVTNTLPPATAGPA